MHAYPPQLGKLRPLLEGSDWFVVEADPENELVQYVHLAHGSAESDR
jgi:hypothetical protein